MAATEIINESKSFLTIIPDSSDWNSQVNFPYGLRVHSVMFFPSVSTDVISLKDESDAGPSIMKGKASDFSGWIPLAGNLINPFLDVSECSFGTTVNVRITFHMA